jgi:hypothetical protein
VRNRPKQFRRRARCPSRNASSAAIAFPPRWSSFAGATQEFIPIIRKKYTGTAAARLAAVVQHPHLAHHGKAIVDALGNQEANVNVQKAALTAPRLRRTWHHRRATVAVGVQPQRRHLAPPQGRG